MKYSDRNYNQEQLSVKTIMMFSSLEALEILVIHMHRFFAITDAETEGSGSGTHDQSGSVISYYKFRKVVEFLRAL